MALGLLCKVTGAAVSRMPGRGFIRFQVETELLPCRRETRAHTVEINPGIKHLAVLSGGSVVDGPSALSGIEPMPDNLLSLCHLKAAVPRRYLWAVASFGNSLSARSKSQEQPLWWRTRGSRHASCFGSAPQCVRAFGTTTAPLGGTDEATWQTVTCLRRAFRHDALGLGRISTAVDIGALTRRLRRLTSSPA